MLELMVTCFYASRNSASRTSGYMTYASRTSASQNIYFKDTCTHKDTHVVSSIKDTVIIFKFPCLFKIAYFVKMVFMVLVEIFDKYR